MTHTVNHLTDNMPEPLKVSVAVSHLHHTALNPAQVTSPNLPCTQYLHNVPHDASPHMFMLTNLLTNLHSDKPKATCAQHMHACCRPTDGLLSPHMLQPGILASCSPSMSISSWVQAVSAVLLLLDTSGRSCRRCWPWPTEAGPTRSAPHTLQRQAPFNVPIHAAAGMQDALLCCTRTDASYAVNAFHGRLRQRHTHQVVSCSSCDRRLSAAQSS
jgi:hypothetical protein